MRASTPHTPVRVRPTHEGHRRCATTIAVRWIDRGRRPQLMARAEDDGSTLFGTDVSSCDEFRGARLR
jgi:hypothetical protein